MVGIVWDTDEDDVDEGKESGLQKPAWGVACQVTHLKHLLTDTLDLGYERKTANELKQKSLLC